MKFTMFISIQDGAYTLSILAISEIEWCQEKRTAEVTMMRGATYTCEGVDYDALLAVIEEA